MNPLVSVVIPTCGRPKLLDRCMEALMGQNFPPDAYEIIVVDDCPEDPVTRRLIGVWQERLLTRLSFAAAAVAMPVPVTGLAAELVREPMVEVDAARADTPRLTYLLAGQRRGPAAARNLGWQAASGEIVAFTDDDCIPTPNWLANGLAAFEGEVAGVSGQVVVPLPEHPTDNERNATGLERSDFVTANCFYRRSALEQAGGFDERFRLAWREDSDLYFTVREHSLTLAKAVGAIVIHPVRPARWGSSLRDQRKSFYNALLYKKHPDLYRQFIQKRPPWNYYGILVGLLLLAAGLLSGATWLAAAGGILWLALTGQFIYRRLRGASHAPGHVLEMVLTSLVIPYLSIYWRIRGALHWRVMFV